MSQVDGYDYGNDEEDIVDEEPTIHDLSLHVDSYPKKLPERVEGQRAIITAVVTRPKGKAAAHPHQRNIALKIEGVTAATLMFRDQDEMKRFLRHLVAAVGSSDLCDDCGTNVDHAAYGLSSDPGLRFCRGCADKRAVVPKILPL